MTYTISLDPLCRMGAPLPSLIADSAQNGFGGISIDPQILLDMTAAGRREVVATVAERDLTVALHGSFDLPVEKLAELADEFAPHVGTITFDPILGWTSAGLLFTAGRMSRYLHELESRTSGHRFRYGVEDFPETPFALQTYRDDLSPLLDSDRFGILIDIGHFNESANKFGYYRGVSPEEHLAQIPVQLLEVHLSDNNGQEDQHLPLGMGTIDFVSVARGLTRLRFDGLLTIEIEPTGGHKDAIAEGKKQIMDSLAFWRKALERADMKAMHKKRDVGDT